MPSQVVPDLQAVALILMRGPDVFDTHHAYFIQQCRLMENIIPDQAG